MEEVDKKRIGKKNDIVTKAVSRAACTRIFTYVDQEDERERSEEYASTVLRISSI